MTSGGWVPGRGGASRGGERLPPFYCPYCGEEDLRLSGPDPTAWRCESCDRAFQLRAGAGDAPGAPGLSSRAAEAAAAGPAEAPGTAPGASTARQGATPVHSLSGRNTGTTRAPGRSEAPAAGGVALVGGGPGDPGLLTVRGRRLLDEADVVITDRLAPREVLAELGPDVEIIEAGKSRGGASMTQQQINDLLVSRARAGRRVVRLKGGDPFVFGRGGEEAIACADAGIACEVVPGVTSAVAGPASAGIPVTHRGVAQGFAVVTAHLDPGQPGAPDWTALAAAPDTLVLLMAVARLGDIADVLVKHGRAPDTPVAVISDATTGRQRVLVSTLAEVGDSAAAQAVQPPAVVVVGEVVRLRSHTQPGGSGT